MRPLILPLSAGIGLLLAPGLASAHAFLDHATPAVGGTVAAPLKEVRMFFTEALEPRFSGAALATAAGQPISTAPVQLDQADHKQMILPVTNLAPGTYKVRWHAVSIDTHRTEGDFTFTVK